MKVFIDHQIFSIQQYGGISRYFCELLKQFEPMQDIEASIPLLFSNNHYLSNFEGSKHSSFFPKTDFPKKSFAQFALNHLYSSYQFRKNDFDIVHPTYYFPTVLNYAKNKPVVVTVHDMIHEKYPHLFKHGDKTAQNKKHLVDQASKIIAISESTKKDLMEILAVPEDKIEVIYHGTSLQRQYTKTDSEQNIHNAKKYILFVGNRQHYKNFKPFIQSIVPLLKEDRDLKVTCAGGGNFTTEEITFIEELGISPQIYQQSFNDETLVKLYQNALCFIFPSLYEGFGIPVLESFSANCPLLCSNTSSLPEVAGDAAIYFDPHSNEEMQDAVRKIIDNQSLRKTLIEKGRKRFQHFSWEKSAKQTMGVYKTIK